MSFLGFIGLLAIVAIMAGALYLSKIANNKEQEIQKKKQHIRHLRAEITDIDELIHTLLIYDRKPDLLQALLNRMSHVVNEGLRLLPDDPLMQQDAASISKLQQQIDHLIANPQDAEIPGSDRQIFLLKKHFGRTIKLLKQLHNDGELNEMTLNDHRARLTRNSLILEVEAYRKQGKEAREQGNTPSAANFYKHAKELLVNSEISFAQKTDMIKTVSKEISGLYVTLPDQEDGDKKSD